MLALNTLIQHSLLYGLILSAVMTALIVGTLYWRPMIWIGDAPADVQAAAPPMSATDRRVKRAAGGLVFGLLFGILAVALIGLRELAGGTLTFFDGALSSFIIFMTFNLIDLVIIDWVVVEWWRPSFIAIPGMETVTTTAGYGYHFRAFLKGTAGGVILSLVVATAAVVVL